MTAFTAQNGMISALLAETNEGSVLQIMYDRSVRISSANSTSQKQVHDIKELTAVAEPSPTVSHDITFDLFSMKWMQKQIGGEVPNTTFKARLEKLLKAKDVIGQDNANTLAAHPGGALTVIYHLFTQQLVDNSQGTYSAIERQDDIKYYSYEKGSELWVVYQSYYVISITNTEQPIVMYGILEKDAKDKVVLKRKQTLITMSDYFNKSETPIKEQINLENVNPTVQSP